MRPRLPTLALLLAALFACTKPRTQIILAVDTDMPQGPAATLTHIRISVAPPGGLPRQRLTYRLGVADADAGVYALPATLGISALDNDGSRSVEVKVDAVSDPNGSGTSVAALFTYTAIAPFEEERTLLMPVFLAGRCRFAPPCEPGFTCGRERCERIQRTLTAVPADFRPEASAPADAVDDLSPPDAATDLGADADADAIPDAAPDAAPACPAPQLRCDNACVDPRVDVAHCGACGARCAAAPNAMAACAAGRCALACAQGFADCDGNIANGCEVDLRVDVRHCGRCGAACSSAGGTPSCADGTCRITCAPGRGDCDVTLANGCEADLLTTEHCGACGMRCALPGAATHRCAAGVCEVATCAAGRGDCDGAQANGCEADLLSDNARCGACDLRCIVGQMCSRGACATTCGTGLTACSGSCVNTAASALHCGGCGRACAVPANAMATCTAGACGFVCNGGFANCNGLAADGCEVDTRSDPSHCGACGAACTFARAADRCVASVCTLGPCEPGFLNCDGNDANGCETDAETSVANCGACGVACSLANATPACRAGRCAIGTCDAGWADCDGMAANGCETSTRQPTHCGACRQVCAPANARPACDTGTCAVLACVGTFADCDGLVANGCEVDIASANAHCGRCRSACAVGSVCSGGLCTNTCAPPTTACGAQCVTLASDPAHCGRCGRVCPARDHYAAPLCRAGDCAAECETGWGECDRMEPTGCETRLTSLTHCGACGVACSLPHATSTCATGACRIMTCDPGWADCDGVPGNGCEVDVTSSVMHCGRCGVACAGANASARCATGACQLTCDPGFADCNGDPRDGCELRVGYACFDTTGCSQGTYGCNAGTGRGECQRLTPVACMRPCPSMAMPLGFCDGAGRCQPALVTCADGGLSDGGSMVFDDLGTGRDGTVIEL